MDRAGPTRVRTTATIVGTILLVVVEMGLLTGVWHLGDELDHQREATATLAGTLAALTPETVAPAEGALRSAVDALPATDISLDPGTSGGLVSARLEALLAEPTDPASLAALRRADAALRAELARATSQRSWAAFGVHAALLAIVSIGWFAWFRRLVDRHRSVERELTSQRVVDLRERRLLALVQNSVDLIVVIEADGTASFVSPSCYAVVGRLPSELVGRHVVALLGDEAPTLVAMLEAGRGGEHAVRFRLEHSDGRTVVADGTLSNLLDEPVVTGWVLTLRDVTDEHVLTEQLAHQAFHDALTGLANRALFADRLDHAIARRDRPAAAMFIDLDDFKDVNDTHGHTVGDRILVAVADRLRIELRPGDTAARLGGDEFAVLMEGSSREGAEAVAARVLDALHDGVVVDGTTWSVGASIGIAVTEPGVSTSEDVLRDADIAMYWAKERGKGTVAVFDAERHAAALDRMALQADLERALADGELVVHYQPTVDLRSRTVTGFEALVRWEHPDRGGLPPGDFVPDAERSGLVVPLGSWVLRQACRAAIGMQEDGEVTMAVNVSARQLLHPGFVDEVATVLADTALAPHLLVLEITESVVLDDVDAAASALQGLRDLGARVAIDDFGTGYSSLSYLARLPVDILKIDKSFIDGVTTEEHAATVTLAILEMSRSLRMSTVAEGVENAEQAAWLEEHDCDKGQGFLWSRAVPLEEAMALLTDERAVRAAEDAAFTRGR